MHESPPHRPLPASGEVLPSETELTAPTKSPLKETFLYLPHSKHAVLAASADDETNTYHIAWESAKPLRVLLPLLKEAAISHLSENDLAYRWSIGDHVSFPDMSWPPERVKEAERHPGESSEGFIVGNGLSALSVFVRADHPAEISLSSVELRGAELAEDLFATTAIQAAVEQRVALFRAIRPIVAYALNVSKRPIEHRSSPESEVA